MTVIGIERIRDELSKLKPELKKPWVILDRLPYIHATDDPNAKPYSTPVVGRFDYMESADYIMACNPDAMSNVLSYVAALKSEIERLKELADSEGTRAVEYLRRARKAEAEIKQLRKDAERYRYLRRQQIDGKPGVPIVALPNGMRSGYYLNEDTADYAIDVAIAKAEGGAAWAIPPAPAWHDAPTEPGLWFNSINHYADIVSQHWIDRGVVANSHARWYGPIPQDTKAEGEST